MIRNAVFFSEMVTDDREKMKDSNVAFKLSVIRNLEKSIEKKNLPIFRIAIKL